MDTIVRRIRPDEGPALRTARLAALADSPAAFGSSHAVEAGRPDSHWSDRAELGAAADRTTTYFAVAAGGSIVGLVTGFRADPASSVELVSMWVAPAHRGGGVAHRLVDAVVGWAGDIGATAVELWVVRGNEAAVRLYERAGFAPTGDHQALPSDPCHDELRMRRPVD